MIIQCQKCHRRVNVQGNWDRQATCSVCKGYFTELNQRQAPFRNIGLGSQFEEIGKTFQSIPHVVIGKQGINQNKPNYTPQIQNNRNLNTQNMNLPYSRQNYPQFQQNEEIKRENLFKKIKDYAMYFLIGIVLIAATYGIIMSFFG